MVCTPLVEGALGHSFGAAGSAMKNAKNPSSQRPSATDSAPCRLTNPTFPWLDGSHRLRLIFTKFTVTSSYGSTISVSIPAQIYDSAHRAAAVLPRQARKYWYACWNTASGLVAQKTEARVVDVDPQLLNGRWSAQARVPLEGLVLDLPG